MFFFRFGRATAIQQKAIPVIASGRDALLVSPAATGKTEAALAPLVERHCQEPGRLSVIYVAPTRALVNDIYTRFHDLMADAGLRVGIKTGDHPNISEKRPPDILITTPESLDSLLGRKPGMLKHVRAVLLDEIHLLDNTYRGDQLIVLLRRMRWQGLDFQLVAMSATVPNPEGIAGRYFESPPEIVINQQVRPSSLEVVGSIEDAVKLLKERHWYKVVWFCNARRKVEEVAARLADGLWRKDRVFVHHASLPKKRRMEVEAALRQLQTGICVATTTLELGIDIGDVDAVVMLDPPLDVSSYSQRIGRGCRRKEGMTAIGIAQSPQEAETFHELNRIANNGALTGLPYEPDPSVAVQQIFSMLFANRRGMKRGDMADMLRGIVDYETFDEIFLHLRTEGWIEQGPHGLAMATTKLMDFAVRGAIHSNIPDFGTWIVVDVKTSRTVGRIDAMAGVGMGIAVGGGIWQIKSVDHSKRTLFAVRISRWNRAVTVFKFRPGFGAFYGYLPEWMRKNLVKKANPETED